MQRYLTFDDVNIVPKYSEVKSRQNISLSTKLTSKFYLDFPIISAPMDTVTEHDMAFIMDCHGGVGAIHRFHDIQYHCELVMNLRELKNDNDIVSVPMIATIGVVGDWKERADELYKIGCRVFLLDVAHGHHILVKEAIEFLKSTYSDADVIAGSVSTSEGAIDLQNWGADAIRFGQGNGSLCETRIRTGIGIPQISGLINARKVVSIPIIADGGIRTIGDIAKALAAGANSVMLGSLLAGTKESPGSISKVGLWPNEVLYKKYRGAASLEAKQLRGEEKNVEGNSKLIPYKGKVSRLMSDIKDGLQSSCSYVGAKHLYDFRKKAEFVEVTHAGAIEAQPHLL